MIRTRSVARALWPAVVLACTSTDVVAPWPSNLHRVHELGGDEGVFAYSRISPNGRFLAYSSEARGIPSGSGRAQVVTVVDLAGHGVVFSEPGIDAYWSPDGQRMIYLSYRDPANRVAIRHHASGAITRDVAPESLGDYFSWGVHGGVHRILTIRNNYYDLAGDVATLPASTVPSCAGMGIGERPLLSKDAQRITTFVQGTVAVRNLTDCADVLDTGLPAAKADFSYDGRYIAFHAPNTSGRGYEIAVVDLQNHTVRTVTQAGGLELFPELDAGRPARVSLRRRRVPRIRDGDRRPARTRAALAASRAARARGTDVVGHFSGDRRAAGHCARSRLGHVERARAAGTHRSPKGAAPVSIRAEPGVRVFIATEPGSRERDVERALTTHRHPTRADSAGGEAPDAHGSTQSESDDAALSRRRAGGSPAGRADVRGASRVGRSPQRLARRPVRRVSAAAPRYPCFRSSRCSTAASVWGDSVEGSAIRHNSSSRCGGRLSHSGGDRCESSLLAVDSNVSQPSFQSGASVRRCRAIARATVRHTRHDRPAPSVNSM